MRNMRLETAVARFDGDDLVRAMKNEGDIKELQKKRQQILHLAAEVAETDDNNVPVLLLQLREILDECPPNTELGTIVRIDLWTYDVTHVCNLALKQDFSAIKGLWETASRLSCILCQCCVGLELPEVSEYKEKFLPDVVENVLTLVAKLHDHYLAQKVVEKKNQYFHNFRASLGSLEWLTTSHAHLIPLVLQSKRFMQILMSEGTEASLCVLLVLENLFKTSRNVVSQLSPTCLHSILDEVIFKISASKETAVGRSTVHLILTASYRHPSLVNILLSKRYRGLKAYLSKWKGRGFDVDVKRLVDLLEAGTATQAERMRLAHAASVIQAFYRGYRQRQRLNVAEKGIVQVQRLFRQRRLEKAHEKQQQHEHEERRLQEECKRIGQFRSSLRKQLKLLESVPAREVNRFMVENQVQAVTKIQAGYRGMVARRRTTKLQSDVKQQRAAVTIQRQFRRYKQREGGGKLTFPVVPGLTDARRVELQNTIVERREKFPPKHRSFEEQKDLHEKAQKMLADHVMFAMKSRKNEQRREALLARLKIDSDQLLSAPKLHDVDPDMLEAFNSRSAPVIAKAQQCHTEDMRTHRLPWWKKLWEEDNVESTLAQRTKDSELELNF